MQQVEVVVIGAGQAGLAVSHELSGLGVDHVVLERGQIGESWRNRWDSFCLVTPNWSVRLPGCPYDGRDPHGFMPRDEIVAYMQRYAGSFGSPVQEHVQINSVTARDGEGFRVETTSRSYNARSLVLATGAYQRPHRPPKQMACLRTCFGSTSTTTAIRRHCLQVVYSSLGVDSQDAKSRRSCTHPGRK